MLTEFEDFSVAAEAADGDAALRELTRLRTLGERVDVVLMDLQMGAGMDGVTATAAIRQLDSPPEQIRQAVLSSAIALATQRRIIRTPGQ